MSQVAGRLRLDMAQFRSLAAFAQFGSGLDKSTQEQLDRGMRLTELLKQPQYQPVSFAEEVLVLFAGTRGLLDQIPVDRVREWETSFRQYMTAQAPETAAKLKEAGKITDEIEAEMKARIEEFNAGWS
jgi:F-type H+-transporting ATPase subunit alpha